MDIKILKRKMKLEKKICKKMRTFKVSKGVQENPRMQDFAPFTPELLGA
jgi:hypothetical protein